MVILLTPSYFYLYTGIGGRWWSTGLQKPELPMSRKQDGTFSAEITWSYVNTYLLELSWNEWESALYQDRVRRHARNPATVVTWAQWLQRTQSFENVRISRVFSSNSLFRILIWKRDYAHSPTGNSDELMMPMKALFPCSEGSRNGLAGPQGMSHRDVGSVTQDKEYTLGAEVEPHYPNK